MALVFEALVSVGLIAIAIWAVSLYKSLTADRTLALAQAEEERRLAEVEAVLHCSGEQLRCLNCNTTFIGPLPDTGCPNCHMSTLVTSQKEYLKNSNAGR